MNNTYAYQLGLFYNKKVEDEKKICPNLISIQDKNSHKIRNRRVHPQLEEEPCISQGSKRNRLMGDFLKSINQLIN